jgi:acetyltransferase-like isoleucine patch superfamily enzyme
LPFSGSLEHEHMNDIYAHPSALVDCQMIGDGTRIWAFSHVQKEALIGAHCNIGEQCFIENGAVIGSYVTIKNGNQVWDGVTLADGVFVGPGVRFTNDLRPRSPRLPQVRRRYSDRQWLTRTLVQKGASIGAGAIILSGNTIGEFAMVAAGAVVTHSLPAYALVMGSPARVVGWVCECGARLEFAGSETACLECGLKLVRDGREGDRVRVSLKPAVAA